MDEFIKLLDRGLHYLRHVITDKELLIYVESERVEVKCPYCNQLSSKRHSVYERSFQDLPMMGKKTKIILRNRKMFCRNLDCSHTTFAESFGFLAPKGKKTKRLIDKILDISLNTSSVSARKDMMELTQRSGCLPQGRGN
ncbi:transposase family protein [Lachnospiraceae bacterium 62-35]